MSKLVVIVIGLLAVGCSHLSSKNITAREPSNSDTKATSNLFVYDSNISNPNTALQRFSNINTVFKANQISGALIELQHEGNPCEFNSAIDSRRWLLECQFALQVYYASDKAIKFLLDSGARIEIPVRVTTQQDGAKCLASAGGREISVCKFTEEKLQKLLPIFSPLIYHEATHLAQGPGMAQFVSARLSPLQEDHATLFSYLMSGKTEFLKEFDGEGQKVYEENAKFGWKPAGQYGSLIALTSLLIDLHRLSLQLANPDEKQKVHKAVSKIYLNMFLRAGVEDNAQTIVKKVLNDLYNLASEMTSIDGTKLRTIAIQLVTKRFLSLEEKDFDGYLNAFSYNDYPIDVSPSRLLPLLTNERLSSPKISFVMKTPTPDTLSLFPMDVVLFSPEQMTRLPTCLSGKNLKDYKKTYKNCLIELGKNGIRVRTGELKETYKRLNEPNESIQFPFKSSSLCKPIDILYSSVFDKDDNHLVLFSVPVGCK